MGTALAAAGSGGFEHQIAIGIGVGLPTALLLASLDPIGRFLPTFWIHKADDYALKSNATGMTVMHWTAFIPWAAVRAIPTFLAALALNSNTVKSIQEAIPQGFVDGMSLLGAILPAVGFAMLLKLMPVRRYWYMLLIGFVLFAYLQISLIGIALFGLAIAIMFITLQHGTAEGEVARG